MLSKQYWFIILTYVLMQFSLPVYALIKRYVEKDVELQISPQFLGSYTLISFVIALAIILLILSTLPKRTLRDMSPASALSTTFWSIFGVFLALIAQGVAATIENKIFGVDPNSQNTEHIIALIEAVPIVMVVSSIIGPILEEIIFRKIIFGALYEKTNFVIAALISSLMFSIVHGEPKHLLLYAAMGFTFAFLYVVTKRIIVSILAHVLMNTFVVIVQLYREPLQHYLENVEKMQFIFGRLFF